MQACEFSKRECVMPCRLVEVTDPESMVKVEQREAVSLCVVREDVEVYRISKRGSSRGPPAALLSRSLASDRSRPRNVLPLLVSGMGRLLPVSLAVGLELALMSRRRSSLKLPARASNPCRQQTGLVLTLRFGAPRQANEFRAVESEPQGKIENSGRTSRCDCSSRQSKHMDGVR